jgi:hypothetical protein
VPIFVSNLFTVTSYHPLFEVAHLASTVSHNLVSSPFKFHLLLLLNSILFHLLQAFSLCESLKKAYALSMKGKHIRVDSLTFLGTEIEKDGFSSFPVPLLPDLGRGRSTSYSQVLLLISVFWVWGFCFTSEMSLK